MASDALCGCVAVWWEKWAYLVAPLVKNLPAMRDTWVWFLGWEDPLETGTATHSSMLAWREFHRLSSPCGQEELDTTKQLSLFRSPKVSMLPMNTMDGLSRVGNYQMIVIQRGAVNVELPSSCLPNVHFTLDLIKLRWFLRILEIF